MMIIVFFLCSGEAFAYVGPGLGLGAIGAILGTIFALLLGLIGILWYPIKRMINKFKAGKELKIKSGEK
jgi:O-antigen/teichoic acid export membrane protein